MPEARTIDAPHERRRRLRRALAFIALAVLLLGAAVVVLAVGTPAWEADGSRPAYPAWVRAAITAMLIGGTIGAPVGLRALILAVAPLRVLSILLTVAIGLAGLVVVPAEVWLVLTLTQAQEPGSRERLEQQGDWDWD